MQDAKIPPNKVVIIGGDHHNGLGLARIFGLNKKKVFAVVISDKKKSWMATSKFVDGHAIFKTGKDGLDFILEKFSNEPYKPVLIPYSDGAALELDLRLNEFKDKFYIPSINGEQGRIATMMEKDAQYKWAVEHGVKMPRSEVVDLSSQKNIDNISITFPCILKPVVSAYGSKFDITICDSCVELKKSLETLKEKGYKSVLAQEYLVNRREMLIVGAIASNYTFSVHEVIRRWPESGGCGSFSKLVCDKDILDKCSSIINEISNYGYKGLIDVETFYVDGDIYLNEINWRNSGGGFRAINEKFYYAFWWFKALFTKAKLPLWVPSKKSYSMVEYADVRHIIKKTTTLFQWIKDVVKVHNYALFNISDFLPFFAKICALKQ